ALVVHEDALHAPELPGPLARAAEGAEMPAVTVEQTYLLREPVGHRESAVVQDRDRPDHAARLRASPFDGSDPQLLVRDQGRSGIARWRCVGDARGAVDGIHGDGPVEGRMLLVEAAAEGRGGEQHDRERGPGPDPG